MKVTTANLDRLTVEVRKLYEDRTNLDRRRALFVPDFLGSGQTIKKLSVELDAESRQLGKLSEEMVGHVLGWEDKQLEPFEGKEQPRAVLLKGHEFPEVFGPKPHAEGILKKVIRCRFLLGFAT